MIDGLRLEIGAGSSDVAGRVGDLERISKVFYLGVGDGSPAFEITQKSTGFPITPISLYMQSAQISFKIRQGP